jgi:hypothetical protein
MASLEDEVSAMRTLERALTKAANLPEPVRGRVLGWGKSRVAELAAEAETERNSERLERVPNPHD